MPQPSPYWGERGDLDEQEQRPQSDARREGPRLDHVGRAAARQPGLLQGGIEPSVGEAVPDRRASGRHLAVYDPKTKKLTHISTCFGTHHLMFAEDANHTLWTSGGGQVVGWLNTKMFDETGDEEKSQGWTALILDTNGNGKRDAYVEPNQPVDPTKDKRYRRRRSTPWRRRRTDRSGDRCSDSPAPSSGSSPGANPPETALAEVYEPPFDNPKAPVQGFSPRGMDVDRNGVVWVALASGHMASFDRRKCKGPLNGPKATGQHCPEGWTLYPEPLPQIKGVTDSGSAEASYYTWVDQFDTLGLGTNTPINTGNASEGLLALKDGKWVVLRVPYPTRLLHEVDGRPHRRSERRLEGPRALVDGQHARAVPHGDREGHDEQGDEVPAASGSAGEVTASIVQSLKERAMKIRRSAWMATCVAALCVVAGARHDAQTPRPNFIFIQADDLGYGDLSVNGQSHFQTPSIDRLAQSGIRFTNYYAGSTVCAPSRSALMTGLHTGHTWIRGNLAGNSLRDEDRTDRDGAARRGLSHGAHRQVGPGRVGVAGAPRSQGVRILVRLSVADARSPAVHRSSVPQRAACRGRPERILERPLHARDDVVHREGG